MLFGVLVKQESEGSSVNRTLPLTSASRALHTGVCLIFTPRPQPGSDASGSSRFAAVIRPPRDARGAAQRVQVKRFSVDGVPVNAPPRRDASALTERNNPELKRRPPKNLKC